MGHILLSEGLEGDPNKLRAINDMPPPKIKQGVQRILGMVNRKEKCDVTLPWQHNFWITTMRSLTNDAGDVEENWKKRKVYIRKTTTVHVRHAFLYAFQPPLHHCDVKLPNFTQPLFEVGEHSAKVFFFFF